MLNNNNSDISDNIYNNTHVNTKINLYFSESNESHFNNLLQHYLWFSNLEKIDLNIIIAIKILKSWRRKNNLISLKGELIEWLVYYSVQDVDHEHDVESNENYNNKNYNYCNIVIYFANLINFRY